MKCSHGGCQTDAVVTIAPAIRTATGDYGAWDIDRPACRNHMATICQEYPINIVSKL